MKFCVIGDSWGMNVPGQAGHGCIDQILQQKGHQVVNISQGGASNFGQLLMLNFQILQQGNTDFDYIIWLHSEPARDFTEFVSTHYRNNNNDEVGQQQFPQLSFENFVSDLEYINNQNYIYAQELYKQYHIPFLVVGGAGKLNETIGRFDCVHWSLPSWFQQILNLDNTSSIPKNCYHHHVTLMCDGGMYDRIEFLQEIALLDNLEKIMKHNKTKFPDSAHAAEYLYTPMLELVLTQVE